MNNAGVLFVGNKTSAEMSLADSDLELALKEKVQKLIDARDAARKAKNFKEADRVRDKLAAMGVVLKDSKDGTTWEVAR